MALLQISEPEQSLHAKSPRDRKCVVGIDLGTTHSLVSYWHKEHFHLIKDKTGSPLFPSVVHYGEHFITVGRCAQKKMVDDPKNTFASIKRILGRSKQAVETKNYLKHFQCEDSNQKIPRIKTAQGALTPIEISAEILKHLRYQAEQTLNKKLEGAVITVPAYFDDVQRQATKDAARIAGIPVLRLLNEPTAAAIAYGIEQKIKTGYVIVYDFGGGTFDISILNLIDGVFKVVATGGDSFLGGDDFDYTIVTWFLEASKLKLSDLTHGQEQQLLTIARDAKIALSEKQEVAVQWKNHQQVLTRSTFEKIIEPLVDHSIKLTKRALRDAKLNTGEIKAFILAGGSTRVPFIRRKVEDFIGFSPMCEIDPDLAVVRGASYQAEILAGNNKPEGLLLLDVIPLSLGIETMGGLTEKLILRNSTIPIAKAQEFTTYKDGQTAMSFHVVQGERELVADNRSLAHFELHNIPPMVAGKARVQVTFQVDADGLLSVSAQEMSTGTVATVEVKPSYGLSDDDIVSIIKKSHDKAAEDIQARRLQECKVNACRLIEAIRSAIRVDKALLDKAQLNHLNQQIDELEMLEKTSNQVDLIATKTEALNKVTEPFAMMRMDKHLRNSLSGKSINDFRSDTFNE